MITSRFWDGWRPAKPPHLAIEVARSTGVRLKLAGEIQPVFFDYWDQQVRPYIDGRQIEYLGEADHALKNELLSRARALLFPIQWEEPFGLVMIEAMACGTPVLAFAGGAVVEIVSRRRERMDLPGRRRYGRARGCARSSPAACRTSVARHFSVDRMAGDYLEVYERARQDAATFSVAELEA